MTGHTPGPWFIADKKFTGGAIIVSHDDPDGGGDSIADFSPCGPWVSEETAYADARLCIAAPDMLAVLRHIRDSYPGYIPDFVEAVNAAIAKAEGRS